jgi:hypothetical protein
MINEDLQCSRNHHQSRRDWLVLVDLKTSRNFIQLIDSHHKSSKSVPANKKKTISNPQAKLLIASKKTQTKSHQKRQKFFISIQTQMFVQSQSKRKTLLWNYKKN